MIWKRVDFGPVTLATVSGMCRDRGPQSPSVRLTLKEASVPVKTQCWEYLGPLIKNRIHIMKFSGEHAVTTFYT